MTGCACGGAGHSRREFIGRSALGVGVLASAGALLSLLQGCGGGDSSSPVAPATGGGTVQLDLSLPQYSALGTVGGSVSLNATAASGLPRFGIIVVRTSESVVTVLDRTCTHEVNQIGALQPDGVATCPRHGAQFNASGSVVRGPASHSLAHYQASLENGILSIQI
ncbi:Rieske 2Fe-2S domain-containing protein [bacterium]|nr:Rieske 2Fe-2S domain-containing protein [bacterium]